MGNIYTSTLTENQKLNIANYSPSNSYLGKRRNNYVARYDDMVKNPVKYYAQFGQDAAKYKSELDHYAYLKEISQYDLPDEVTFYTQVYEDARTDPEKYKKFFGSKYEGVMKGYESLYNAEKSAFFTQSPSLNKTGSFGLTPADGTAQTTPVIQTQPVVPMAVGDVVSYKTNGYVDFETTTENIKNFIRANGLQGGIDPYQFYDVFNDPTFLGNMSTYQRDKLHSTFKSYLTSAFRDLNYESKEFSIALPGNYTAYATQTDKDLLATNYDAPDMFADNRTLYGLKDRSEYVTPEDYYAAYYEAMAKKQAKEAGDSAYQNMSGSDKQKAYSVDKISDALTFFANYLGTTDEEKENTMNAIMMFSIGAYGVDSEEFKPIWDKLKGIKDRDGVVKNLKFLFDNYPVLAEVTDDPELKQIVSANTKWKDAQVNLLGTGIWDSQEDFDAFMKKYASGKMTDVEMTTFYANEVMKLPESEQASAINYMNDLFNATDRASAIQDWLDMDPMGSEADQQKNDAWLAKAYGDEATAFTYAYFNIMKQIQENGESAEGLKTPADVLKYVKTVRNTVYGDSQIVNESEWEKISVADGEDRTTTLAALVGSLGILTSASKPLGEYAAKNRKYVVDPEGNLYRNKVTGEIIGKGAYNNRLSDRSATVLEYVMGTLNIGEHLVTNAQQQKYASYAKIIQNTYAGISDNEGVDKAEEFTKYLDGAAPNWSHIDKDVAAAGVVLTPDQRFDEMRFVVKQEYLDEFGDSVKRRSETTGALTDTVDPKKYLEAVCDKLGITMDIDNFIKDMYDANNEADTFKDLSLDVRKQTDYSTIWASQKYLQLVTNPKSIDAYVQKRLDGKKIDPDSDEYKALPEYRYLNGQMTMEQKAEWLGGQQWYLTMTASLVADPLNAVGGWVGKGGKAVKNMVSAALKGSRIVELASKSADTVADISKVIKAAGLDPSAITSVAKGVAKSSVVTEVTGQLKKLNVPDKVISTIKAKNFTTAENIQAAILKADPKIVLTKTQLDDINSVIRKVADEKQADFIFEKAYKLQGGIVVKDGDLVTEKTIRDIAEFWAKNKTFKGLNDKVITPFREWRIKAFGGAHADEMLLAAKDIRKGHVIMAEHYAKQMTERIATVAMNNVAMKSRKYAKELLRDKSFKERFTKFFNVDPDKLSDNLISKLKDDFSEDMLKFVDSEKEILEKRCADLNLAEFQDLRQLTDEKKITMAKSGAVREIASEFQILAHLDFKRNLIENGFKPEQVENILASNSGDVFALADMSLEDIVSRYAYMFDLNDLQVVQKGAAEADNDIAKEASRQIDRLFKAKDIKKSAHASLLGMKEKMPSTYGYLKKFDYYDMSVVRMKRFMSAARDKSKKVLDPATGKWATFNASNYFSKSRASGSKEWIKDFFHLLMVSGDEATDEIIAKYLPEMVVDGEKVAGTVDVLIKNYNDALKALAKAGKLDSFMDEVSADVFRRAGDIVTKKDGVPVAEKPLASKYQIDAAKDILLVTDPLRNTDELSKMTKEQISDLIFEEKYNYDRLIKGGAEDYELYLNTTSNIDLDGVVAPMAPMGKTRLDKSIKDAVNAEIKRSAIEANGGALKGYKGKITKEMKEAALSKIEREAIAENKRMMKEMFNPTSTIIKVDLDTWEDFVAKDLNSFYEDPEINAGWIPEDITALDAPSKIKYAVRLGNITGCEISPEYINHLIAEDMFHNSFEVASARKAFIRDTDFDGIAQAIKSKGGDAYEAIRSLLVKNLEAPVTEQGRTAFSGILDSVYGNNTKTAQMFLDEYIKIQGTSKMDRVISYLNQNLPMSVERSNADGSVYRMIQSGTIGDAGYIKPNQITKLKQGMEKIEGGKFDNELYDNLIFGNEGSPVTKRRYNSLTSSKQIIGIIGRKNSSKYFSELSLKDIFDSLSSKKPMMDQAEFDNLPIVKKIRETKETVTLNGEKVSRVISDDQVMSRFEETFAADFKAEDYGALSAGSMKNLFQSGHKLSDYAKRARTVFGGSDELRFEKFIGVYNVFNHFAKLDVPTSEAKRFATRVKELLDDFLYENANVADEDVALKFFKASHNERMDMLKPIMNSIKADNDNAKKLLWAVKQLKVLESKLDGAALKGYRDIYDMAAYSASTFTKGKITVKDMKSVSKDFASALRRQAFFDEDFVLEDMIMEGPVTEQLGKMIVSRNNYVNQMTEEALEGRYIGDVATRGASTDTNSLYDVKTDIMSLKKVDDRISQMEEMVEDASKFDQVRSLYDSLAGAKTWYEAREIKAQIYDELFQIDVNSADFLQTRFQKKALKFYNAMPDNIKTLYVMATLDRAANAGVLPALSMDDMFDLAQSANPEKLAEIFGSYNGKDVFKRMKEIASDLKMLDDKGDVININKAIVDNNLYKISRTLESLEVIENTGLVDEYARLAKSDFKNTSDLKNFLDKVETAKQSINSRSALYNELDRYRALENLAGKISPKDFKAQYAEIMGKIRDLGYGNDIEYLLRSSLYETAPASMKNYTTHSFLKSIDYDDPFTLVTRTIHDGPAPDRIDLSLIENNAQREIKESLAARTFGDVPAPFSPVAVGAGSGMPPPPKPPKKGTKLGFSKSSEVNSKINPINEDGFDFWEFNIDGYRFRVEKSVVEGGQAEAMTKQISKGLNERGLFSNYIKQSNILTIIPKKSFKSGYKAVNMLNDGLIIIENPDTIQGALDLIMHEFGENTHVLEAVAMSDKAFRAFKKKGISIDQVHKTVAALMDNSIAADIANWADGTLDQVANAVSDFDRANGVMDFAKIDVIAALRKNRINPNTLSDSTQVLPELLRYFGGNGNFVPSDLQATMRSAFPMTYDKLRAIVFENKYFTKQANPGAAERLLTDYSSQLDHEAIMMVDRIDQISSAAPQGFEYFAQIGANSVVRRRSAQKFHDALASAENNFITHEFADMMAHDLDLPDWAKKDSRTIAEAMKLGESNRATRAEMQKANYDTLVKDFTEDGTIDQWDDDMLWDMAGKALPPDNLKERSRVVYDAIMKDFYAKGVDEGFLGKKNEDLLNFYVERVLDSAFYKSGKRSLDNFVPFLHDENIYKLDQIVSKKGLGKGYFQKTLANLYVLKAMGDEKFLFESQTVTNVLDNLGFKVDISGLSDAKSVNKTVGEIKKLYPNYNLSDLVAVTVNGDTAKIDLKNMTFEDNGAFDKVADYIEKNMPGTKDSVEYRMMMASLNRKAIQEQNLTDLIKKTGEAGSKQIVEKTGEVYMIPRDLLEVFTGNAAKQQKKVLQAAGFWTGKALKFYDSALAFFKRQVTLLNPGFYATNFIGNTVNSYLGAGIKIFDPKRQGESLALSMVCMLNPEGAAKGFMENFKVRGQNGAWWSKQLHTYNVVSHSIFDETTINMYEEILKDAALTGNWRDVTRKIGKVLELKPLASVNMYLENQARIASFLTHLDEGMSGLEAAELTNKFMFDYADLNNWERNIMKRIVPFYTWVRKNVALQSRMLFEDPVRMSHFYDVYRNVQRNAAAGEEPEDPRLALLKPEYMYSTAIYTGRSQEGLYQYTNIQFPPLEPFRWINQIDNAIKKGQSPFLAVSNNQSPLIQMMGELLYNKRLDWGQLKDITTPDMTPAQKAEQVGLLIRDRIFPAVKNFIDDKKMKQWAKLIKTYEANPDQLEAIALGLLKDAWGNVSKRNAIYDVVTRRSSDETNDKIKRKLGTMMDMYF